MPRYVALSVLLAFGCSFFALWAQQNTTPGTVQASSPVAGLEMPVTLRQKIVAGKTPPGTRVQANLVTATLVNGNVIPRNAILSGEILESKAKTQADAARLSIRLDSAQWNKGSAAVQLYLTSWFYPVAVDAAPELHGPEQSAKGNWNGMGQYPDPRSPNYHPFPSNADTGSTPSSDAPASVISKQRVSMKDAECERDSAGLITLVGKRSNIKLDTLTTYVFATSNLAVAGGK
jgi:hypothetical protein